MADMLKRSSWVALAGVGVVGALAFWLTRSPDLPEQNQQAESAASRVAGAGANPSGAAAGDGSARPWAVTVSDAMGTTMDAARLFELGFAGGLVIDRDTRASIEALLNSLPEDLSEKDLERLERTLREGLPKEDAEKAFKLINDYRDYTQEVRDVMQPKGIPNSMEEAKAFFDQMEAVKRRHFDEATASALFGQADTHARLTMEAMFVQQDNALSAEQKNAQLDALRAQLPADQQSLIPRYVPEPAASQPAS
jgi:lipase chaperone LimK